MTTAASLIGAEIQRRRIPERWSLAFVETTNDELAGMTLDTKLRPEVRAYAIWELEYREAAGIEVFYDVKADNTRRSR